jgi:hypothetical protein
VELVKPNNAKWLNGIAACQTVVHSQLSNLAEKKSSGRKWIWSQLSFFATAVRREEQLCRLTLEPILRLLNLQLQRRRCSRLEHFYIGKK